MLGSRSLQVFRRILLWLGMVWLAYTLVFILVRVVPGDPVRLMLGEQAGAADLEAVRHRLGLDVSIGQQYLNRLQAALHGDFGQSLNSGSSVLGLLLQRLPYTLILTFLSLLLAVGMALPLGMAAGRRKGTWVDRGATAVATAGLAIPNFWLGPLLIMSFSIGLGWFPTSWNGTALSWVLPAVTLGTSLAALLTRIIRAEFVAGKSADFVRTAVAKGLSQTRIDWVHILRNLLIPVTTVLGLQVGALMTGSVVTENIFAIPGLGQLMLEAINQRDYPVVEGCTLWIALVYLSLSVVLDATYRLVDPRQRNPEVL